ncbi:MAG TPA: DUF302 domain-containing protein [Galbitalea sp.]|jgi:uncharacterized protein (DUF302 family)
MTEQLSVTTGAASVADTVQALRSALAKRGIELFAVIDHAAGAAAAGLELDDEVVAIFGNPTVGTRVMQADRRSGIDLPLRMLVWREDGETRIGYEDPHGLATRFSVAEASAALDGMAGLLSQLAAEIAGA